MVSRPRLVERLRQGVSRKVTLISAPAGFGKTTLLAEWLTDASGKKQTTAWISLDIGDNDPTLFWSYFIAALQTLKADVGESALALLYASQASPITSVLSALINEVNKIEHDFALVLDDYHLVANEEVHSALVYLIGHLPSRMHLVIASRTELPFPVARLRARGELTELRVDDLQFTTDEAAAFFKRSMGLNLTDNDVAALEHRTEGWIAGLQLAALSMQGRNDAHEFVDTFGGDDRYIADFMVEEVLGHQPENIRRFLLKTSILSRLNGSLCDALTGQKNGREMLQSLEQSNLFVIPLDDKRHWYRYHHLFGDTIREILVREYSEEVSDLNERASVWYEKEGLLNEAIQHAFEADNSLRLADLIETIADDMYANGQSTTLYSWLKKLPEDVSINRPVLSFWRGWAYMDRGEFEAPIKYFQEAERLLGDYTEEANKGLAANIVIVDKKQFRALPGRLATALAMSAQALGDAAGMITYAQRALNLLPEEDYLFRGGTTVILGLASWARGDLERAYQVIAEGFSVVEKTGEVLFQISGTYLMADIRVAQGRLREALGLHKRLLRLADKQTGPVIRGTADIHLCISEILLEQGNYALALEHFETGKKLGEDATNAEFRDRWVSTEARFKEILGEYDAALELLDDAEQLYMLGPVPCARPYAARKARIWIVQERFSEALAWAQAQDLSVDDELSYIHEYEHITLARLLIAQHQVEPELLEQAKHFLTSLLKASEEGGRRGSLIEILMLQVVVNQLEGNTSNALALLKRALDVAEPEHHVQVFVAEGKALHELLKAAITEGIGGDFARQLYAAISKTAAHTDRVHRGEGVLIEPLSNREIEVLRLIAAGMRNQEIADHLYISLATVKRHISNMYGKLEVSHRTEAVAKANDMNLL